MSGQNGGKPDFHQDVLVTGLTETMNMLVRFLASVIVARGLGAEDRGVYALALAAPGLLLGFANIGLGEATTVLIGKGKYPRERIIASMNFLVLLIAVAGFAVYFGLAPLVMKALKHNLPTDVYALAFCVFPLTLYWGGNASAALGLSMVKQVSWGRLLNNSVFLALATVAYLRGAGVKLVLAAFIAALLIENLYLLGRVRRAAAVGLRWDPEMIREQAVLGWHVFWGGLFLQVTRRLDIFLLNFFAGPGPLGVYVVAYSVAEFILAVPGIYSRAAFSSAAVSSGEEGFRVSNAAIRQTLFLMIAGGALLAVFMRAFILKVYGAEFLPAVLPALLLLPGVVLFGFGGLLGTIFTGFARPRELMRSAAVSCLLTVVLDLLLIPRYGAVGAAAASSVAYAASALWILVAYLKFSRARLSDVLLVGPDDFRAYKDRFRCLLRDRA